MQPENKPSSVERISAGAAQLLVGPASSRSSLQMNVRSSTRATSCGSERARYEFGRFSGFSRRSVPVATICSHKRSYSAREPSHQMIRFGSARRAIRSIHCSNP